jgi:hypothetical protein
MTMRERTKKPITRAALYSGVVGAGGAAGLVHYPLGLMVLLLVTWGVISTAIILVMQWRTRCPNCRAMLGAKGRAVTKDNTKVDNCPHCGVKFDQPLESVAGPE